MLACRGVHCGEAAPGRRIGRNAAEGRAEPDPGAVEVARLQPHPTALEIQHRQRKRRHGPVAGAARAEERISGVRFTDLGLQDGERREGVEAGPAVRGRLADRQRVVIAPERLEDRGTLAVDDRTGGAQALRLVEVVERFGESVERGARPRAGEPRRAVGCGIAYQAVSEFGCSLSVVDAAEQVPAQR